MLIPLATSAKVDHKYYRYDLICRGALFDLHKFKSVDKDWKDYAALDRVILDGKGTPLIYYMRMPSGNLCILMPKPYSE